jgi:hypothetical protein
MLRVVPGSIPGETPSFARCRVCEDVFVYGEVEGGDGVDIWEIMLFAWRIWATTTGNI